MFYVQEYELNLRTALSDQLSKSEFDALLNDPMSLRKKVESLSPQNELTGKLQGAHLEEYLLHAFMLVPCESDPRSKALEENLIAMAEFAVSVFGIDEALENDIDEDEAIARADDSKAAKALQCAVTAAMKFGPLLTMKSFMDWKDRMITISTNLTYLQEIIPESELSDDMTARFAKLNESLGWAEINDYIAMKQSKLKLAHIATKESQLKPTHFVSAYDTNMSVPSLSQFHLWAKPGSERRNKLVIDWEPSFSLRG